MGFGERLSLIFSIDSIIPFVIGWGWPLSSFWYFFVLDPIIFGSILVEWCVTCNVMKFSNQWWSIKAFSLVNIYKKMCLPGRSGNCVARQFLNFEESFECIIRSTANRWNEVRPWCWWYEQVRYRVCHFTHLNNWHIQGNFHIFVCHLDSFAISPGTLLIKRDIFTN